MDITNVASLSDNGPLGNVVCDFWSSRKFTDAQPFDDPYDAVNKLPENWFHLTWKTNFNVKIIVSPQIDDKIWRLIGPLTLIENSIFFFEYLCRVDTVDKEFSRTYFDLAAWICRFIYVFLPFPNSCHNQPFKQTISHNSYNLWRY